MISLIVPFGIGDAIDRVMINLNKQAIKSLTASEIEPGQLVYVRHLAEAYKVESVNYLDRGLTVRIHYINNCGVELPIDLGASELVYLLKGSL